MFKRTSNTNQEEIKREMKINRAREYFAMLSPGKSKVEGEGLSSLIKDCLEAAGVGYEALDPSGKKTGQEMLSALEHRCREGYIKEAQGIFADLATTRFSDIVETEIELLEKALKKAKAGYEALDISDRKVAAEMKAELDQRVKKNFIYSACSEWDALSKFQGDRFLTESFLSRIEKRLKAAGAGYEVLDPTGKKSAETIEKEARTFLSNAGVSRPASRSGSVQQPLDCCSK